MVAWAVRMEHTGGDMFDLQPLELVLQYTHLESLDDLKNALESRGGRRVVTHHVSKPV